jgi:predicted tellurium resistance membrane protein TerC
LGSSSPPALIVCEPTSRARSELPSPGMFELFNPDNLLSLVTLTLMEIVLGIDNIVFLTILVGKVPAEQQPKARTIGLVLALGMRLGLLLALSWIMRLTEPLFTLPILERGISGRDLILLGGGLFLIAKSTHEIYDKLEHHHGEEKGPKAGGSVFGWIIVQIVLLDIVFSLDSVITAVGMAQKVPVMVAAMVIAVGVMLVSAASIGSFIERHPSMKILALSFLLLIGVMLLAEGMGQHVSKGYIYFAMAFAMFVEVINMRMRRRKKAPVKLHGRFEAET